MAAKGVLGLCLLLAVFPVLEARAHLRSKTASRLAPESAAERLVQHMAAIKQKRNAIGLGGLFWEHGTCENSTYWMFPDMGSSWELAQGSLEMQRQFTVPGTTQKVTYQKAFYAVLNPIYLSLFANQEAASSCARPKEVMKIKTFLVANPFTSPPKEDPTDSRRYCVELLHRPALVTKTLILCLPSQPQRQHWLALLRSQIRLQEDVRALKRSVEHAGYFTREADAVTTLAGRTQPKWLFPAAPHSVCVDHGDDHGSHCLTAAPGAAEREGGEVAVFGPAWSAGAPVRAIPDQRWRFIRELGQEVALLCLQPGYGEGRCLTVEESSMVEGTHPAPPRVLTDCPGHDYSCGDIKSQPAARAPQPDDALECQKACWDDKRCQAWSHRPASLGSNKFARCCLRDASSAACAPATCCSAGLKSDVVTGAKRTNTLEATGVPGRIVLRAKEGTGSPMQRWNIIASDRPDYAYVHLASTAAPGQAASRCLADSGTAFGDVARHGYGLVLMPCADGDTSQQWLFTAFE